MNAKDINGWNANESSGGRGFWQGFFEGNYFYILSALLMMLGCYLLMRHPLFPGSIFFKKFQALFLLQAYEVLVIITAALIVRRFSRLGDAFTLFAIELALLLDPTFFSNAFFTMVHENVPLWQVTLVNAACLLLVPVKILLLRKTLGIRLTPRMTAAFLFAGATVYLAELPLSTSRGAGWYHQFYYALGWMPLALAALLPSLGKGATVSGGPDYISRRQRSLLDRLLLALPLLIVAAHYLESSQVHGIRFYWLYGAPLLLALGVVIIRHTPDDKAAERIVLIDIISILAILVSIGPLNTGGKAAIHGLMEETPEFITRHIPLIVCGLGVILLYVYYFFKFRYKPALARVALLLFCGMTWFLIRIMVTGSLSVSFGRFMRRAIRAFGKGVKWLFGNPVAFEALIGAVLWIWVLKKRRTFAAWMPAGCFSLFVLFRHLPLSWENKFPEMFQAMCLYIVVLYHMLLQKSKERYVFAMISILFAVGRFLHHSTILTGGILAIQSCGFFIYGLKSKDQGYLGTGSIGVLILCAKEIREAWYYVNPAILVIGIALGLFGAGTLVTFNKEAILKRLGTSEKDSVKRKPEREAWPPFAQVPVPAATPATPVAEAPIIQEPLVESLPPETPPPQSPGSCGDRDNVARLLEAVFMTEPNEGIFRVYDLETADFAQAGCEESLRKHERPIVTFGDAGKASGWKIMLTDMGLVTRKAFLQKAFRQEYTQIAGISRQLGTLVILGHAGQVQVISNLQSKQAQVLKTGLELVMAELAFDPSKMSIRMHENKPDEGLLKGDEAPDTHQTKDS